MIETTHLDPGAEPMPGLAFAVALLMASPIGAMAQSPASRWVTLSTGVSMHYVTQGDTLDRPVVFVHGLHDSWRTWQRILAALPPRIHVIALDLRGHGGSDKPGAYRVADFADDVARFLEVRQLRNVTLVGHSLGSIVAREVVRRASDRVAGLVLISSAARLGGPGAFDDRARLRGIRVPTMIIWGELDTVFSKTDQEDLLGGIAGSRLVSYRSAGHAPHWEVAGLVLADLLAFLNEEHELR